VLCSVTGAPPPNVTWARQDGVELDRGRISITSGGGLRISHAQIRDEAQYRCYAYNYFGNLSAVANVTITGLGGYLNRLG